MAKKDKLIKSKSIYTIKNRHTVTNNGVIYENDHVTIIPNDGIYDDEMALFSESNFKYKINTTQSSKKRHNRGDFIKPEGESGETWTLSTLSSASTPTEESTIVLKPNYTSLKDFAYYGSAVELIRATINDVVLRFPGSISYYDEGKAPLVISGTTPEDTYYLVSNEFDIDCWTVGFISSGTIKNPMRILAASYMNYVDSNGKDIGAPSPKITGNCPNSIIGNVSIGGKKLDIFMDGEGKKYLVTTGNTKGGVIIKPKQEFIDKFWDSMDDFERVLLNRDTTPVYKAIFETPFSNDTGYYYENKSYVWPTVNNDGFTPDVTTGAFQGYLESLISLATFHDEFDSDNIWRMMTHESIKNLDWTYNTQKGDVETDLTDFDTKGIGAMMRIYGRQFDDIKRYADNIKNSNTLSYDEKSNAPDYFLSDTIENEGWEAQHSSPFTEVSDIVNYSGVTLYASGKTSGFVNSAFQRRLALSSNYIQSMKGTRRSIETILGMFGYQPNSSTTPTTRAGFFDISEYVAIVSSGLSYDDACEIRSYGDNPYEDDDIPHLMYGYPVAVIRPGDEKIPSYMVPWYDKSIVGKTFYFQSKGGWGKRTSKPINLPKVTSSTTLSGITIYGETQPYMRFAKTIDEMLGQNKSDLYEGIICYVTDISTIERDYICDLNEKLNDCSHYFSLVNVALSTHCGFLHNDIYGCYGWKQITNTEISGMTTNEGKKVVYLESLIADYKGNNPHIGYGEYDDGSEYIEHFTHLFKKTFEMGLYDRWKEEKPSEEKPSVYELAATFGFTVCEVLDNKKCAYFHDYESTDVWLGSGETLSSENWNSIVASGVTFPDTPPDCVVADESQANGIINIKKLVINFGVTSEEKNDNSAPPIDIKNGDGTPPTDDESCNPYLMNYIQNVVLKYLEQMIPSTAILEYRFNNKLVSVTNGYNLGSSSFRFVRTAHAALTKDDDAITVWREYPTPINEM